MSRPTVLLEDAAGRWVEEIPLGSRRLTLGRDRDCGIRLPSPFVSKRHATIEPESAGDGADRGWVLTPAGLNGTRVNRRRLREGESYALRVGDVIEIPGFRLRIVDPDARFSGEHYRIEMARGYSRMTASLHEQLLQEVDLRALIAGNLPEETRRRRIREALGRLLDRRLGLDDALRDFIVRESLQSVLNDRFFHGGDAEKGWSASSGERAFQDLVLRCERRLLGSAEDPNEIRDRLARSFDGVYEELRSSIPESLSEYAVRRALHKDLENLIFHLGPLEDLLKLPGLEEVMVIGNDRIFIERSGSGLQETGRTFPRDDDLDVVIGRIVHPIGRFVNRSHPIVDARLEDGSRVNIVIPPVSLRGPAITIRKFRAQPFTLEELIENGTVAAHAAKFLRGAVAAEKNIIISGGTGSGKTTLLNCLGSQIPDHERLVVIEDAAELQLPQPNQVVLEAKRANIEGEGAVTIRDLVRTALRMRPDRIIVGECRGKEALDMLQAMNTGHDGSLTTAHANSPADMISRLEVMVLEAGENLPIPAIHRQIAGALHLVVQIQRGSDRRRRVTRISEVVGYDPEEGQIVLEDVFRLASDGRDLAFTGYLPTFIEELIQRGEARLEDLFRADLPEGSAP